MLKQIAGSLLTIFFMSMLTFNIQQTHANQNDEKENISIRGEYQENLYKAGGFVNADFTSLDDVYIAGGEIDFKASVQKDLFLAGGSIIIQDSQAQLAAVAGGTLSISQSNFRELILAGGNIQLDSGSISDDLVAAGGNIRINQDVKVGGSSNLAGGKVTIKGQFLGNVRVYAKDLYLAPSTIIKGSLSYYAEEVEIDPKAQILGDRILLPKLDHEMGTGTLISGIFLMILFFIGALFIAPLLSLFFPKLVFEANTQVRENFWSILGKGTLIILLMPITLTLLFISILGFPFAMASLPFIAAAFILAWSIAAFIIGNQLYIWLNKTETSSSKNTKARFGWTILGTFVLNTIVLIPFLGFIFCLLATLVGFGALCETAYKLSKKSSS